MSSISEIVKSILSAAHQLMGNADEQMVEDTADEKNLEGIALSAKMKVEEIKELLMAQLSVATKAKSYNASLVGNKASSSVMDKKYQVSGISKSEDNKTKVKPGTEKAYEDKERE